MYTTVIGLLGPLVMTIAFFIGYAFGIKKMLDVDAKSRPYKWVCPLPDCVFAVEGNNMEVILKLAENHERTGEKHVL